MSPSPAASHPVPASTPSALAAHPAPFEVVLPEAKMHLYRPNEPVTARITKTEICTNRKAAAFVRHIEFDVSGTALEGNVLPGQSIGVLAPGVDAKGRPHAVRLYSIACPTGGEDGRGRFLSTTVKRTIDEHEETHKLFLGVASNYLCDLAVGDEVKLSGPNGKRFLLPVDRAVHDYVFFATGTGIAPFRGMVMDLLTPHGPPAAPCAARPRVTLIMGAPYATDLLYDEYFRSLAAADSNFTYLPALSRERQADGQAPMYVQERIKTHHDHFAALLGSDRTLVYICGLAGMELGIFQNMARMLSPSTLERYVTVDQATLADINGWNRKMIHRQVKATKRVFLEVYE